MDSIESIRRGIHQQKMDHELSMWLVWQFIFVGVVVGVITSSFWLGVMACFVPLVLMGAFKIAATIGSILITLAWTAAVGVFCYQLNMPIAKVIGITLFVAVCAYVLNYRGIRGFRELI